MMKMQSAVHITPDLFVSRTDMMVSIAQKVSEGLDKLDTGSCEEYSILLFRAGIPGKPVRMTMRREDAAQR